MYIDVFFSDMFFFYRSAHSYPCVYWFLLYFVGRVHWRAARSAAGCQGLSRAASEVRFRGENWTHSYYKLKTPYVCAVGTLQRNTRVGTPWKFIQIPRGLGKFYFCYFTNTNRHKTDDLSLNYLKHWIVSKLIRYHNFVHSIIEINLREFYLKKLIGFLSAWFIS